MEWATFEFNRKASPETDKHLEVALESIKANPEWGFEIKALVEPDPNPNEFPMALGFLWEYFQDLSRGRTSSGFGWNLLPWSDILAWCQLTDTYLSRWMLATIKELDTQFVVASSKK